MIIKHSTEVYVRRFTLLLLLVVGCARTTPVEEISVTDNSFAELPAFTASDADWPGWRGPDGNAIARSSAAPIKWSDVENVVWRTKVAGRGHASPTVVGNLVLASTSTENEQIVLAFDRATGTELWNTTIHEGNFTSARKMHGKSTHANGTVACDDQRVFAAFLNNDAVVATALDFQGKQIWQTKLGAFNSKFGYAPSPLVYKSLVIFAADNHGGGYLVAVHRETGQVVWRKARPAVATYSSPIVGHVAGKDQLLISGCGVVASFDPNTGEKLWEAEGTTDATCGTIVWNDTTVFAAGGYPDKQVVAIAADGSGKQLWSDAKKLYEPSMLLVGSELYGVTDGGVAYCWNAADGKTHWKKRLGGGFSASPVYCDGRIYVSNLSGTTFVFNATADSYQQVAKNQLGDDAYASPLSAEDKSSCGSAITAAAHGKNGCSASGRPNLKPTWQLTKLQGEDRILEALDSLPAHRVYLLGKIEPRRYSV